MNMPFRDRRHAVTVVELLVAAVIGAILSLAITKVFFSSVRVSQKGMEHLNNVQNASIVLTQIDQDLRRADSLQLPPADLPGGLLQIAGADEQGLLTVVYQSSPDGRGVMRRVSRVTAHSAADQTQSHLYCQGLPTTLTFEPVTINTCQTCRVSLRVSSAGPGGEEIALKRLFYLPNLPDNHRRVTCDWTYGN